MLGGLIILAGPATTVRLIFISGQVVWLAITVGVVIAICGLFLWFEPVLRHLISVMIIVLAIVSVVTSDLGGFFIGMLLAIIGGSMGFSWRAVPPPEVKPAVSAGTGESAGGAVAAPR